MSKILETIEQDGAFITVSEGNLNESDIIISGDLNVDTFIIPNQIGRFAEFMTSIMQKQLAEVCDSNSFDVKDDMKFVQLWHTAPFSDNVTDNPFCIHGITFRRKCLSGEKKTM
jgi:hypothetical protein